MFFVPAKGDALQITEDQFGRFLKFVNPKQIIILGNKNYVSEKYIKLIDPSQTVCIISNDDWDKTAQTLGKILKLSHLEDDFAELATEMDTGQLYPPEKEKDSEFIKVKEVSIEELEKPDNTTQPVIIEEDIAEIEVKPQPVVTPQPKVNTIPKVKPQPVVTPQPKVNTIPKQRIPKRSRYKRKKSPTEIPEDEIDAIIITPDKIEKVPAGK